VLLIRGGDGGTTKKLVHWYCHGVCCILSGAVEEDGSSWS